MPNPQRLFGTAVIVPVGGLALAWSAVAIDSALATQAISGTATLTAGTYSPDGFINHVAKKLRTSVYDAICAQAWFTTEPANAAAVPLQLGIPAAGLTEGVGQTLLRFKCATTGGALHTGLSTSWQSFSVVNTSNNWCWLGMAYPGETRALAISAGGFDDVGRFQPRWLFVTRNSFQDSGDYAIYPGQFSELLGDETVAQYSFGVARFARDMSIRIQPQHLAGPPWAVGRFSGFGATRNLLALDAPDETLFTGISNTHKRTDNLVSPVYLRCGRWWARYRDESPSNTFRCLDVWPASITPNAGEPVQAYSELFAMLEEWRRVGLLFPYEPIDNTGLSTWLSKAYAPRSSGEWSIAPARHAEGNLYYNCSLEMLLVPNPQLATP
jgi:hypothetical protein